MKQIAFRDVIGVAGVVVWATLACAQEAKATPPPARRVTAGRTTGAIVLDGRLDEADWQHAAPATDLVQRDPDEGRPATERTEVRFLFDDDALYVGARMFDREPARIARRLTRRDADPGGIADAIVVALDPHHDHLTGAAFIVSAAGTLTDLVLFNDEGDDGTWDAVWEAEVAADDQGWTAEMRIPFSQLRFPPSERQVWGVNVIRYIQRTNEESWWSFVPKKESGFVSRMGELDGLDGIRSRSHLDLLPYATARGTFSGTAAPGDPFNDGRTGGAGLGLDLKWGFTSNMTLDAAVNPDYGQVEVDPAVVNLTAFETFFEEKRPFFIEGSQAFGNYGRNGVNNYMGFNRTIPTLFYSRRIGRAPQGTATGEYVHEPAATTVLGAAKLTGKTSSAWTVNLIDAVTAREWADTATGAARGRIEVEPFTNYLATRARRDVGQRAGFGVLATAVNRDLRDPALADRLTSSAIVVGADGHLFLTGKNDYVVAGSFSGSRVAGSSSTIGRLQQSSARYDQRPDATHLTFEPAATSLSGWSLQTDFNKNSGNLKPNASFWAVSPGFEVNDAGFVTNADRMGMHAAVIWQRPTPDRFSRSRWLLVSKWYTWNFAREKMGDGVYLSGGATFRNYWNANLTFHWVGGAFSDRLTRGGPMMRSPGVRVFFAEVGSDERKPVVLRMSGSYEPTPERSWSANGAISVVFKPIPSLTFEAGPALMRGLNIAQYVRTVTDPSATATYGKRYVFGEIDQTELSLTTRANLMLSPTMSLQLYLQPLISTGRYTAFKEAARPRTFSFLRYGADIGSISFDSAAGAYLVQPSADGTGQAFSFPNPDFNFKSLRLNTVFRWEFRPGSTVYVVWTDQREDTARLGTFALGPDISRLFDAPGDNVFMVKFSYWFSR